MGFSIIIIMVIICITTSTIKHYCGKLQVILIVFDETFVMIKMITLIGHSISIT